MRRNLEPFWSLKLLSILAPLVSAGPLACDAESTAAPSKEDVIDDGRLDNAKADGAVPADWTCSASWYGTNDGCDNGCCAQDPDCADPDAYQYNWNHGCESDDEDTTPDECISDYECADPLVCRPSSTADRCQVRGTTGASCDEDDDCAGGRVCEYYSGDDRCRMPETVDPSGEPDPPDTSDECVGDCRTCVDDVECPAGWMCQGVNGGQDFRCRHWWGLYNADEDCARSEQACQASECSFNVHCGVNEECNGALTGIYTCEPA